MWNLSVCVQCEKIHTCEKPYACKYCKDKVFLLYESVWKFDIKTVSSSWTDVMCLFKLYFWLISIMYPEIPWIFSHLTQQEKIHTGEKPCACNICKHKVFNSPVWIFSCCVQCEKIHTGEKPYAC